MGGGGGGGPGVMMSHPPNEDLFEIKDPKGHNAKKKKKHSSNPVDFFMTTSIYHIENWPRKKKT